VLGVTVVGLVPPPGVFELLTGAGDVQVVGLDGVDFGADGAVLGLRADDGGQVAGVAGVLAGGFGVDAGRPGGYLGRSVALTLVVNAPGAGSVRPPRRDGLTAAIRRTRRRYCGRVSCAIGSEAAARR
jgi:hypothetical protein